MNARVAVGSLFIECNHLGGTAADLDSFRRSELDYGEALLTRSAGTVGGMLQTLRTSSIDILPLLVATACPSGPLTTDCYNHLKQELLARLRSCHPVHGVLLALHGAAAAESAGDLEGDLLTAVREVVGPEVPVVATLDLHAHVTCAMVDAADVLIAWETYPHRDAFETGERGARALIDMLSGRLVPAMALAKAPVLVGGVLGHTEGPGPFADVMRLAKSFEKRPGVYSTSAFLVHPYLDLPDMGGGGLVVTHDNPSLARELAAELAERYWQRRFELEPPTYTPHEAIRRGIDVSGGPVLLVETADCCGGGAAGDSVAALRSLLAANLAERSLAEVVDPAAAAACHHAGVGESVTVDLGHRLDPQWGDPIQVTGIVRRLSDGRFTYRGGIWEGQSGRMGPSACLQVGTVEILIATHATYEWLGEQYDLLGMDAASAKFVVVKNPMNYRMAYGPIARDAFLLNTPGPTPASVRHVSFRNLKGPWFPAVSHIEGMKPQVCSHP